jgi:hypothetical protein
LTLWDSLECFYSVVLGCFLGFSGKNLQYMAVDATAFRHSPLRAQSGRGAWHSQLGPTGWMSSWVTHNITQVQNCKSVQGLLYISCLW